MSSKSDMKRLFIFIVSCLAIIKPISGQQLDVFDSGGSNYIANNGNSFVGTIGETINFETNTNFTQGFNQPQNEESNCNTPVELINSSTPIDLCSDDSYQIEILSDYDNISWYLKDLRTNAISVVGSNKSYTFTASATSEQELFAKVSYSGCIDTSDIITINATKTANINQPSFNIGKDTTICTGGLGVSNTGGVNVINWSTTGLGILSKNSDSTYYIPTIQEYETGSIFEITASTTTPNPCITSVDTLTLAVLPKRTLNAGLDQSEVNNGIVTLQASSKNAPAVIWSTLASGELDELNNESTTFDPSPIDREQGLIKLTLTIPASDGCSAVSDDVFVTLVECNLSVAETKTGNTVELLAINSNSRVLSAYTWSFGDSFTSTGQAVTHTYNEAGTYNVILNSTSSDNLCNSSTTHSVTIQETPTNTYTIQGSIDADGIPLDYGLILIYYVSPNNTYEVKQQFNLTPSDNGVYNFGNLEEDNYFISVQTIPLSVQSNNSLPTFFGDVTNWNEANKISLSSDLNNLNITLSTFTPPTDDKWKYGADKIKGNVTFDENYLKSGSRDIVDNPLPVQNAVILLYDKLGSLLTFTSTDKFGEFNFKDLAAGVYEIKIQYLGTSVSISQTIIIDGDNQTIDEYAFKIGQESTPTGISLSRNSTETNKSTFAYPNPTAHKVTIALGQHFNQVSVDFIISDRTGKKIITDRKKVNNNSVTIDLQGLPSGIFFIHLVNKTHRIIKY